MFNVVSQICCILSHFHFSETVFFEIQVHNTLSTCLQNLFIPKIWQQMWTSTRGRRDSRRVLKTPGSSCAYTLHPCLPWSVRRVTLSNGMTLQAEGILQMELRSLSSWLWMTKADDPHGAELHGRVQSRVHREDHRSGGPLHVVQKWPPVSSQGHWFGGSILLFGLFCPARLTLTSFLCF